MRRPPLAVVTWARNLARTAAKRSVFGLCALLFLAPFQAGCETILGEVTLADPAPGEPCAKGDSCAPNAECLDVNVYDDDTGKVCLPKCGAKGDEACPASFTCVPRSNYTTEGHCYPSVLVQSYAVGDSCPTDGNDPCPSGSVCAERPSDYYAGDDVSNYCLVRCSEGECTGGQSCEQGEDGFFCE
jgi:hypothetical protein